MQRMMKHQTVVLQTMQENQQQQYARPPKPSFEQPKRYNNDNDGRKFYNQQPWADRPKQANIVSEESPSLEKEECSYPPKYDEDEDFPREDNVHILTDEELDALFSDDNMQPFTVSESDLQQIIAHSIKVAQREIAEKLSPRFEEPSIGNVQNVSTKNPDDSKQPTQWGNKSLPLQLEPVSVPSTSQPDDNVLQRVRTAISKTVFQVPLSEYIQLTGSQSHTSEMLGLHVKKDESDPPIMLQSEVINRIGIPPFYMSLNLGRDIVHNCMLDSRASTNVMPLRVMRQLGLDVHRPYRNMCGLDSKSMPVQGVITNMLSL